MADIDHKALAAQILGHCEAIELFAGTFHAADEVPPSTLSKLQRCKDHLDQALIILNEST
jgi:hypothetical protein